MKGGGGDMCQWGTVEKGLSIILNQAALQEHVIRQ